ncbi:MAG: hypothetical protein F6K00_00670 [Leptolyngbya sp. SIOISBB]|nr:hypothetical protein [Leptolyngbya sp. SIOISBB]
MPWIIETRFWQAFQFRIPTSAFRRAWHFPKGILLYLQAQPDQERSIALSIEVLKIAQDFQHVPTVMPYAATAVQVLKANGVDRS